MRSENLRPPVTLEGRYVRLVPTEPAHIDPLAPIWRIPEVNRYLIGVAPGADPADLRGVVAALFEFQRAGTDLLFTTVLPRDDRPIGMTRFLHIERRDDEAEIGGTWLDPRYWRTPINTEAKLLLLAYAFEREGAHRIYLQTDLRNSRSQAAIRRLGAVPEATVREDRRLSTGGFRSSVYFSILREEWPAVRRDLEGKLALPWSGPTAGVPTIPERAESRDGGSSPPAPVVPPLKETDLRPPVHLVGEHVELVPLERSLVPALARAGHDPRIWEFLRIGPGRTEEEMGRLVDGVLEEQQRGEALAFAVLSRPRGVPVGMFRYLHISRLDRLVETGTWLDPAVWRTPVNTEVKFLGLSYAFEQVRVHRVQLRTDSRNTRSQRAIERLGGVREGVFREHVRRPDGTYRTSVSYSLLESEWPDVKERLRVALARPWPGPVAGRGESGGLA